MSIPKDKNYVSFSGTPDGELWLVDYRLPEGETHTKLRDKGGYAIVHHDVGNIDPPYGYHDSLKISGAINLNVMAGLVRGGMEDCVDINHSTGIRLIITRADPLGRYIATIKGGSTDIWLTILALDGHGNQADIDIGNWAQGFPRPTTGVYLSVGASVDRIGVRVINGDRPTMEPKGKFRYNGWLRGWFVVVQRILKKLGIE